MPTPTNVIIPITNFVNFTKILTNEMTRYQQKDILTDWVVGIGTLILAGLTLALVWISIQSVRKDREKLIKTLEEIKEDKKILMEASKLTMNTSSLKKIELISKIETTELNIALNNLNRIEKEYYNAKKKADMLPSLGNTNVENLKKDFDNRRDEYLKEMNKLCGIIFGDIILEKKYKIYYKKKISNDVKKYKEILGDDTKWESIIALNKKWQSEDD